MINRKHTKKINIGNIEIGGDSPISVQSMTNTDTRDIKSTVNQIKALEDAGCELVRLAVLNQEAANCISSIKKQVKIPLIADIHFDYRLAITSIEQGIDALRLNPGNIGKQEFIKKVVEKAKEKQIPIRIGVNSGSLEKDLSHKKEDLPDSLASSALRHIKILEDLNFDLIKVSLKSSNVITMIKAYQKISSLINYPLHLGVTEAGTFKSGIVKSSIGIGSLLAQGIGDTIRVSLTENPVEEIDAGFEILKSLELRQKGINFISCPTCGRCQIDLINLAKTIEERFKNIKTPLTIAIMGCPVNGPGEAKSADIGVAGGIGEGYIFKNGEIIKKVPENQIISSLEHEIKNLIG